MAWWACFHATVFWSILLIHQMSPNYFIHLYRESHFTHIHSGHFILHIKPSIRSEDWAAVVVSGNHILELWAHHSASAARTQLLVTTNWLRLTYNNHVSLLPAQAAAALKELYKKHPVLYNSSIVCSFEPKVIYRVSGRPKVRRHIRPKIWIDRILPWENCPKPLKLTKGNEITTM